MKAGGREEKLVGVLASRDEAAQCERICRRRPGCSPLRTAALGGNRRLHSEPGSSNFFFVWLFISLCTRTSSFDLKRKHPSSVAGHPAPSSLRGGGGGRRSRGGKGGGGQDKVTFVVRRKLCFFCACTLIRVPALKGRVDYLLMRDS